MKGDRGNFVLRLRRTLPEGWFSDEAPVLQGVLSGFAEAWEWLYGLLGTVRLQSRLVTVSGGFLDLACQDFFGPGLQRRSNEPDAALRARLFASMRRERGTRQGVLAAAADAGFAVRVFEPARPADTGAYSTPGQLGWGVAGGWGSLALPLTCFVTGHAAAPVADLKAELAQALPAGGVAWLRIAG